VGSERGVRLSEENKKIYSGRNENRKKKDE
jgi:hypothetical protein